jgi:hypothetical protein
MALERVRCRLGSAYCGFRRYENVAKRKLSDGPFFDSGAIVFALLAFSRDVIGNGFLYNLVKVGTHSRAKLPPPLPKLQTLRLPPQSRLLARLRASLPAQTPPRLYW